MTLYEFRKLNRFEVVWHSDGGWWLWPSCHTVISSNSLPGANKNNEISPAAFQTAYSQNAYRLPEWPLWKKFYISSSRIFLVQFLPNDKPTIFISSEVTNPKFHFLIISLHGLGLCVLCFHYFPLRSSFYHCLMSTGRYESPSAFTLGPHAKQFPRNVD
jgi:hypothetical protein